jgi:hypothetical protein
MKDLVFQTFSETLGEFGFLGAARLEHVPFPDHLIQLLYLNGNPELDERLSSLPLDDQELFYMQQLTAFHEMFHFHQFILTPTGLQIFLWEQNKIVGEARMFADSLQANGRLTGNHLPVRMSEETFAEIRNLGTNALYVLQPKPLPAEVDEWYIGRTIGRQTYRLDDFEGHITGLVENGYLFPFGAVSIMESWAHSLTRTIAASYSLDRELRRRLSARVSAGGIGWKYSLLDRLLEIMFPTIAFRRWTEQYFGLVSLVSLYALNSHTGRALEGGRYFADNPDTHCGYRLLRLAVWVHQQERSPRNEVEALHVIDEGALALDGHSGTMIGDGYHALQKYIQEIEAVDVSLPGFPEVRNPFLTASRIYEKYHTLIAQRVVNAPNTLFHTKRWRNETYKDTSFPRPPLNFAVIQNDEGATSLRISSFIEDPVEAMEWFGSYVLGELLSTWSVSEGLVCPYAERHRASIGPINCDCIGNIDEPEPWCFAFGDTICPFRGSLRSLHHLAGIQVERPLWSYGVSSNDPTNPRSTNLCN